MHDASVASRTPPVASDRPLALSAPPSRRPRLTASYLNGVAGHSWLLCCSHGNDSLRPFRRPKPDLAHHSPPAKARRPDLGSSTGPMRRSRRWHALASACRLVRTRVRPHGSASGRDLSLVPRARYRERPANTTVTRRVLSRAGAIRTLDPLNPIQVRYQAAPQPEMST